MFLDINKLHKELSDEYILLIRLHHFSVLDSSIEIDNKFVFNVSSYKSAEDLYIISDLLITDYSSVMFDYALLNKPMLFFTYDLEEYRDNLRGMYFDIDKEAPGPLLYTNNEIIATIKDIDNHMDKYKDKIDIFRQKYLTFECENSCKKIVKEVLKPNILVNYYARLKRKIRKKIKQFKKIHHKAKNR